MNIGERVEVKSAGGFCEVGTVERIEEVEEQNCFLVDFRFGEEGCYHYSTYMIPRSGFNVYASDRKKRSLMPVEYVSKSANDFKWDKYGKECTEQKMVVNTFITQFREFLMQGRGLYIYSRTKGSGKTMLSCCVANEIVKRYDMSVKFVSIVDYLELVKSKIKEDQEAVSAILDCTLLIIDDIGINSDKQEWINSAIYRLIDRRYTSHLPTIFTSNVEISELKTDERVIERVYEVSIPVKMPEVNVRRKIADNNNLSFINSVLARKERE
jgi:DNA replication protein DnaC